jgi:hypothetical protein
MQKIHVASNIRFRANIHLRFSHTGEYSLANILILANIHVQLFKYQRIFATYCYKLFRKAFHKSEASINIWFFLKIFPFYSFLM